MAMASISSGFCMASRGILAPGLIGFENGEVRVGDEPERQVIFCYEALMRGSGVAADAYHLVAEGEETLVVVAEVAGFGSASGSGVLRVEIEYQFLAFEVAELYAVSVFVETLEVGSFCSWL